MKIYISYAHSDGKEAGLYIAQALKQKGFEVWEDTQLLPGEEWEKKVIENLNADAFIIVVSEGWLSSSWIQQREIPLIFGFAEKDKSKIIIPVVPDPAIWNDDRLPLEIKQRMSIIDSDPNSIVSKLITGLHKFEGSNIANNIIETQRKEIIEKTAAEYVQETISIIEKKESRLKFSANIWYTIGFLSLFLGIIIVIYLTVVMPIKDDNWISLLIWGIKSAVILILLLSASKYSFNLAKSYMTEALKNSDRIHSISFGKFYLQIFRGNLTGDEIKDIFRDWNMDKQTSSFSTLSSNDYDPKLIELIFKVADTLKDTITKK